MAQFPIGRAALEVYDWLLRRPGTLAGVGGMPFVFVLVAAVAVEYFLQQYDGRSAALAFLVSTPMIAMLAVRWATLVQGEDPLRAFYFGRREARMLVLGLTGLALTIPGFWLVWTGIKMVVLQGSGTGFAFIAMGLAVALMLTIVWSRIAPLAGHIALGNTLDFPGMWRSTRSWRGTLFWMTFVTHLPLGSVLLEQVMIDSAVPGVALAFGTVLVMLLIALPILTYSIAYRKMVARDGLEALESAYRVQLRPAIGE